MTRLKSILSNAMKPALRIAAAFAAVLLFASGTAHAQPLATVINEFQRISNDKTPFGVTDGNPQAATALLATDAYDHFGLRPTLSNAPQDAGHFQVGLSGSGGTIDTKSVSQYYATTDLSLGWRFNDTIGAVLSIVGEYRNTHTIDTYMGGVDLGLPITLIDGHKGDNSWALTPWVILAGVSGSEHLAQGGYLFGGGLTSSFSHRMDKLTLTLADQIGYDAGFPFAYSSEFDFEQNVSQFILKNGVQATYDFTDQLYVDGGVSYTNFLKGGYTDNYFTTFAGVGYRFGKASGVRVGYVSDLDFSNEYYTYGGEVEFYLTF